MPSSSIARSCVSPVHPMSSHGLKRSWLRAKLLSLSRLNHWVPGREAHPEVVQGTADVHHQIADTLLPQTDPVFDDATALDTAVAMLDPQPALGERLIRHLLLQRQFLPARFLHGHQDLHLGE